MSFLFNATGSNTMDGILLAAILVILGPMVYALFAGSTTRSYGLGMSGGSRVTSSLKWILIAVALYFVISYFKNRFSN